MARESKHKDVNQCFWNNVQTLRLNNRGQKLYWNEISEKLGISQQTLSGYCAHNSMPKIDLALDIADALGVTLDTLLDESLDVGRLNNLGMDEQEIISLLRQGSPELYQHKVKAVKDILLSLNSVGNLGSISENSDIEK